MEPYFGVVGRTRFSSYSLYATHASLVFFVWAAVGGLFRRDWFKELPTPLHWIIAFAPMAVAYGFSRLTEVRTKELRGTLRLGLHYDWVFI